MNKLLVPLLLFVPLTAKAGYINYEMLDSGTLQVGTTARVTELDGKYNDFSGTYDVSSSSSSLDIELKGGVSQHLNFALQVSPVGSTTNEFTSNTQTIAWEYEGMDDLKADLRIRLAQGSSYPVLILGVTLPTGDDTDAVPELKSNTGTLLQAGSAGGHGNGRTDYKIASGYLFATSRGKIFVGGEYIINGNADGTDYGDDFSIASQASFPLTQVFSLVGSLSYTISSDTRDEGGEYSETTPALAAQFGGMFSISQSTEIMTTVTTLTGSDTDYYGNTGTNTASLDFGNAVMFEIKLRSRF